MRLRVCLLTEIKRYKSAIRIRITSVSTHMKQDLAWETVSRENIQILNHVFWFKSAIEKATNEMFSEVDKLKDSVVLEDIQ